MYERILLALDESEAVSLISSAVALAARSKANGNQAHVLVLHVRPGGAYMPGTLAEAASEVLESMGVRARAHTVQDEHSVAVPIARAAESFNADLIVMGSRGLGELRGVYVGSVSRGVIIRTDCPVLLIKSGSPAIKPRAEAERVLAAVESVEDLETIIPALSGLGQSGEVIVFHVPEMLPSFGEPPIRAEFGEEAEATVRAAVDRLRAAGIPARARLGTNLAVDVGRAIAAEASACGADMIVVSSRRPGSIEGVLVGSTARAVLHYADCPVLIAGRPDPVARPRSSSVPQRVAMTTGR